MELVEEDVSFRESVLKVSNYLLDEMEVWQWAASQLPSTLWPAEEVVAKPYSMRVPTEYERF